MTQIINRSLIDADGNLVRLHGEPLAVGGEGSIHNIMGDHSLVAKVYNKPQSKIRSEKLLMMVRIATPGLLKVSAWPVSALYSSDDGRVAGILMPKIVGYREVHRLYSTAQRKKDFPDVDWRFLAHAAYNCAIAFDTVHRHGHVVGDVNQKNILVSDQAIVKFVDCDSFQIKISEKSHFRCEVGVTEFTPPELQRKSFRDVDREPNHDRFGLAVLIFHLLMMGRHPFSGIYTKESDVSLEKAIQAGLFAYGRSSVNDGVKPPPRTLPITVLDESLINLFERAFIIRQKGAVPERPTAAEWKSALAAFLSKMEPCKIDSRHYHATKLGPCPWCRILGETGLMFFKPMYSITGWKSDDFDAASIWKRIEAVSPPDTTYSRPSVSSSRSYIPRPLPSNIGPPTPTPELIPLPEEPPRFDYFLDRIAAISTLAGLIAVPFAPPAGLAFLVGFGFWFYYLSVTRDRRKQKILDDFDQEIIAINDQNNEIIQKWITENLDWVREYRERTDLAKTAEFRYARAEAEFEEAALSARVSFQILKKNLETAIQTHRDEIQRYRANLAELAKKSHQFQLESYLESTLIRDSNIKEITPHIIMTLSSFGIETALDLEQLMRSIIPGVDSTTRDRLLEWKKSLTRNFRPKPGVPADERAAIDQRSIPRIRQLEAFIADGPVQLRELVDAYRRSRDDRLKQLQILADELDRAIRDKEILENGDPDILLYCNV